MKYGKIPKKILDIVLGECYGSGNYTLKYQLDRYGQDIIYSRYSVIEDNGKYYFQFFHAWTKDYAMILTDDIFEEKIILGIERNPPKEVKWKKKKKRT